MYDFDTRVVSYLYESEFIDELSTRRIKEASNIILLLFPL